jgi:hypothetical protein
VAANSGHNATAPSMNIRRWIRPRMRLLPILLMRNPQLSFVSGSFCQYGRQFFSERCDNLPDSGKGFMTQENLH